MYDNDFTARGPNLFCCFFETNLQFELRAVLLLQGFTFDFPPFSFAFSTEKGS